MGVAITELLKGREFSLKELNNKIVAIDAFNALYQFLTVLRGPDGSPLKNKEGKITSHLQGLLSRNIQYISEGIKLVYVFDGKPPELKLKERERRRDLKKEAKRQYLIAKERNDFEKMRKYASRMVTIDEEIIESSKKLLSLMGIAQIQAPCEGEAQVAHMLESGKADFAISQDVDALLFGAPNIIRNISSSGKKKIRGKLASKKTTPQIFFLKQTLEELELSRKQLIAIAMLTGTDYNVGGIKGLGPKKSLDLVKSYKEDFKSLFEFVEWDKYFDVSWEIIMDLFLNCEVDKNFEIVFPEGDLDKLKEFLVKDYGFDEDRVFQNIDKLESAFSSKNQKGLSDFF